MKKPLCRTAYIAEHSNQDLDYTAVYGYDPEKNEAFVFIIKGRILYTKSTRGCGNELIGPCNLREKLFDYDVPDKHLDAIKEEQPF
jgi:hypothetical protein